MQQGGGAARGTQRRAARAASPAAEPSVAVGKRRACW